MPALDTVAAVEFLAVPVGGLVAQKASGCDGERRTGDGMFTVAIGRRDQSRDGSPNLSVLFIHG
jgi:hypothetical protein